MQSMNEGLESRSIQQHIWGSGKKSARPKDRLYVGISRKSGSWG